MAEPSLLERPSLDIYMIAIGGTGMAPLACLLKELGHRVRGVDGPLYPPMSDLLRDASITPLVGFSASHLEEAPTPDLVIVGNAVPRQNVEAAAMERLGIPRLSMPEALWHFLLRQRRPLVVAGTHGKTTTTALAAWVFSQCGGDPGFLIGGLPKNFERSFRIGSGPRFVVEGDEYNAAYFDRGPKFLHYGPQTLILNSVEYDHADLYPSHEVLLAAYRELVAKLPPDGLLIYCGDTADARAVAATAPCETVSFGFAADNDFRPEDLVLGEEGSRFRVRDPEGDVWVDLPIAGEHNVANAMAVFLAARRDLLPAADIVRALASFEGVRRRLDEIGTCGGVTVVDDFAHHPTAVGKSLGGLRQRFPGRRLVAVFEPRSLTAGRAFFFEPYLEAFKGADEVVFAPVFYRERLGATECLDVEGLRLRLAEAGIRCQVCSSNEEVLSSVVELARPGDVVVTMSSGSFDGMPHRIHDALCRREA